MPGYSETSCWIL